MFLTRIAPRSSFDDFNRSYCRVEWRRDGFAIGCVLQAPPSKRGLVRLQNPTWSPKVDLLFTRNHPITVLPAHILRPTQSNPATVRYLKVALPIPNLEAPWNSAERSLRRDRGTAKARGPAKFANASRFVTSLRFTAHKKGRSYSA
jgi:hypothetical protein